MQISMICVTNADRAIGYKNKLLWYISEDLQHFKKVTTGHVIIMGDKTLESMNRKPLPNRTNVIISRDLDYCVDGCLIAHSLEESLEIAKREEKNNEIFIIGGGSIYTQMLKYVDKLYLTIVDDKPANVDTFFPEYSEFTKIVSEEEQESGGYKYKFMELVKE